MIQNIEICYKKVDILAEFPVPGSRVPHRVIVECKFEKKPHNQTALINEFNSLIITARKEDEAESAAIITKVPWGDRAKGLARKYGIELLTFHEKLGQLIDFSYYLNKLVDAFEKKSQKIPDDPPLGKYYIDSRGEQTINGKVLKIPCLEKFVKDWVKNNETNNLAILGEYGTGKTSFCIKLTHDLAKQHINTPLSTRIPILLNLREFTKELKMESFIDLFLDEDCNAPSPKYSLFKEMNDAGFFLLIFDGFDEMAGKVDSDTLIANLIEIEKLGQSEKSKIIITSRTEYFVSVDEERKCFNPRSELLPIRDYYYERLILLPWKKSQINAFLKKRVPLIKSADKHWTYYQKKIDKIPVLQDLSERPVFLDMIVKTLPQLISSGKPINLPNLYEQYLSTEIRRQKISKGRKLLLSKKHRLRILQNIASDFYAKEFPSITYRTALEYIDDVINPTMEDLQGYTREFLTCSFLIRKKDKYEFSHWSIMEYLVAKELKWEIQRNTPHIFSIKTLDSTVISFLIEMSPNIDSLYRWINDTKMRIGETTCLGGNAVTLLTRMDANALKGKDLSKSVLKGANLSFADLRDVDLNNADLIDTNLNYAKFRRFDLLPSKLKNVKITTQILYKIPVFMIRSDFPIKEDIVGHLSNIFYGIGLSINKCETIKIKDNRFLVDMNLTVDDNYNLNRLRQTLIKTDECEMFAIFFEEKLKLWEKLEDLGINYNKVTPKLS